ncbi:WXG100 family type VII secretion target [Listeria fleischmannii]|uniref:WXG100 family type VII secretion target n=1 Tax=Listeria fleischmannii FSL S10-1203 TaxID=1265822 RepID=W7D3W1_9LIST|nr:WXG100 family type VII secretion target [Listeria fleischmannii]EUJ43862.1 hypothetical protein MCOL2_20363 [Listeria fleischmannii FSL S10-1203]
MANRIKIHGDKLEEAISYANQLEKSIQESYQKCETFKGNLDDSKWSGAARDAFVAYFDLIYQYHQELHTTITYNGKALKALHTHIADYNDLPKVKEVRNLS